MQITSSQTQDEWLEPTKAAQYIGVSIQTLTRYEGRGLITSSRLPDYSDGRKGPRRFRRGDLDALIGRAS